MSSLVPNLATVVVLLAVVIVTFFAVRSLLNGATSCETCNGNCGGCGMACSNPQIKLSAEQLEQLAELKAEAGAGR